MTLDKEQMNNLISMLNSSDSDNHVLAILAIDKLDYKKNTGEILLMYKFGKCKLSMWEDNAPKLYKFIRKVFYKYIGDDSAINISSGSVLSMMIANNGSRLSIEVFLDKFENDMSNFMEVLGYPKGIFDINIKFKEDGQSTES